MKSVLENIFANFYKLGLFAFLFAFAAITFFAKEEILPAYQVVYHYSFFALSVFCFFALLFFNQLKSAFFILVLFEAYLYLNYLRNTALIDSVFYYNIGFFLPIGLALSALIPENKLLAKNNVFFFVFLMLGVACFEHLSKNDFLIYYNFTALSIICGAFLFLYSSIKNKVLDYAFFFAYLCAVLGYYFAFSASAFTMFFGMGLIIMSLAILFFVYGKTFTHQVSGLKTEKSFDLYIKNLPLKYALVVICIDDFNALSQKFSKNNLKSLVYMISQIIKENHIKVFHFGADEFVLVLENQDKAESFEEIEEIRRKIAKTDFILKKYKQPIKMTVSCALVEKKRSDGHTFEVLQRAQKLLSKTKDFNHNFTSQG